jgi:predicted nucleic acid-binding protein
MLGVGERQVLALAMGIANSLVILDDGRARRIGRLLGLRMTGTVGILARGTREGLIPRLLPMLDRLESLGFRLSREVKAAALRLVGEGFR